MKVGEQAAAHHPAALGYGAAGTPKNPDGTQSIPGNATLVFDVELVGLARVEEEK